MRPFTLAKQAGMFGKRPNNQPTSRFAKLPNCRLANRCGGADEVGPVLQQPLGSFPGPFREVIGKLGDLTPHAFNCLLDIVIHCGWNRKPAAASVAAWRWASPSGLAQISFDSLLP